MKFLNEIKPGEPLQRTGSIYFEEITGQMGKDVCGKLYTDLS